MTPRSVVSIYVSAHPDDWQMFRGEMAWEDLSTPGTRTVFIYLTAGDAGRTDGWWEAREAAALESVRGSIPACPLRTGLFHATAGQAILRHETGRAVSYCLRLPDGNLDGRGFPAFREQSLTRLRKGEIGAITAVDQSARYRSWAELTQAVREIMEAESARGCTPWPWVNSADYDPLHSPGDHADHYAAGELVRQIAWGRYSQAWWVGFDIGKRAENLDRIRSRRKQTVLDLWRTALAECSRRNGTPCPDGLVRQEVKLWGRRSYARTIDQELSHEVPERAEETPKILATVG